VKAEKALMRFFSSIADSLHCWELEPVIEVVPYLNRPGTSDVEVTIYCMPVGYGLSGAPVGLQLADI
jgi:hypothetical protein